MNDNLIVRTIQTLDNLSQSLYQDAGDHRKYGDSDIADEIDSQSEFLEKLADEWRKRYESGIGS